jgi:threonine dehydratase
MAHDAITLDAFLQARARIAPFVRSTPLLHSPYLSQHTGGQVWLKLECWQHTGSFKVRGALNKIGQLTNAALQKGIVTGSAGNHGLGVAYAARAWAASRDIDPERTFIFVPHTAPRTKIIKMRYLGVTVKEAGQTYEDAHQAAEAFSAETGAFYVPAYDDAEVIAGQGTVALEIFSELPETDLLIVPVGGGGLIAGISLVAKATAPHSQVIGLQPAASPAALLSLRDGRAYDPYDHQPTIADGLAGGFGAVPYALAGNLIDEILLANEGDIRSAVYTLLDQHQLVVEPSAAIAITALLDGTLDVPSRNVVCVLTGANIETSLLHHILTEQARTGSAAR